MQNHEDEHLDMVKAAPVDTGHKLNVHKTFRRRPGRLLNVLYTFNLRPVSAEARRTKARELINPNIVH